MPPNRNIATLVRLQQLVANIPRVMTGADAFIVRNRECRPESNALTSTHIFLRFKSSMLENIFSHLHNTHTSNMMAQIIDAIKGCQGSEIRLPQAYTNPINLKDTSLVQFRKLFETTQTRLYGCQLLKLNEITSISYTVPVHTRIDVVRRCYYKCVMSNSMRQLPLFERAHVNPTHTRKVNWRLSCDLISRNTLNLLHSMRNDIRKNPRLYPRAKLQILALVHHTDPSISNVAFDIVLATYKYNIPEAIIAVTQDLFLVRKTRRLKTLLSVIKTIIWNTTVPEAERIVVRILMPTVKFNQFLSTMEWICRSRKRSIIRTTCISFNKQIDTSCVSTMDLSTCQSLLPICVQTVLRRISDITWCYKGSQFRPLPMKSHLHSPILHRGSDVNLSFIKTCREMDRVLTTIQVMWKSGKTRPIEFMLQMDKITDMPDNNDFLEFFETYDLQMEMGMMINTVHSFSYDDSNKHWQRQATPTDYGILTGFYLLSLYGSRYSLDHETLYNKICPPNPSQPFNFNQIMKEPSRLLRGYMIEEDEAVIDTIKTLCFADWATIKYPGDKDKLLNRLLYFHKVLEKKSSTEVKFVADHGITIKSFTAITDRQDHQSPVFLQYTH